MSCQSLISVCKKCRKEIEDYGCRAFKIVICVYFHQMNQCPIFIDENAKKVKKEMLPVIRHLEKKGIVTTTEVANSASMLEIQVNERYTEQDGKTFLCWCEDVAD